MFLLNNQSSAYANNLKFIKQCVEPQYTIPILWSQSYAPKLTNGKFVGFFVLTLISHSQMVWDFFITMHKSSLHFVNNIPFMVPELYSCLFFILFFTCILLHIVHLQQTI